MSFVRARNIATVIVGCSSIVPNDNMLFVGDKESLPFTIGVDGTLWSSLVDAMDAGAILGRLVLELPCSLGATESNLRLGERRTLKLRICNSFMCWCCIVSLKESTEEVILDVGTISWLFVETFGCSRWNCVWVISKRCSMKIREGKSCPMFLCDCKSVATILALFRETQCESPLLTLSKVDSLSSSWG